MKPKAHILVVEDKALIYKRLKMVLSNENYSVDGFTPSVEEAIGHINTTRPDLVLLDIDLQGEHNGLYLGKLLSTDYHIPFIYVTEYDDDQTFYNALATFHEDFVSKKDIYLSGDSDLVVQTKPHLDEKKLIRAIQNTLNRYRSHETGITKEGIMGLMGYLDDIKIMSKGQIAKVPVKFKDILFFTVKPFINEDDEEEELRPNYLWFLTNNKKEYFFLKTSLRELQKTLPYYFVRINESYIVNLSPEYLEGRINGSIISIQGRELHIKKTYKEEVEKRLQHFYQ
ncbi:MAG: response regulator [Mangrovimonas sp.]|nr:response regulator [Mangrovimonas sp.]MCB0745830.1 response regulator [Ignavibacteriota bacterium]